jgi:hypothetical protein
MNRNEQRFCGELQRVSDEQRRYVEAIALTGDLGVLTAALRDREHQRRRLEEELRAFYQQRIDVPDASELQRTLRSRLGEWRSLLRGHASTARTVLAKLIDGRLTLTPDLETRRYRLTGNATLGPFLEAVIEDGTGPLGWRARRDLNLTVPLDLTIAA